MKHPFLFLTLFISVFSPFWKIIFRDICPFYLFCQRILIHFLPLRVTRSTIVAFLCGPKFTYIYGMAFSASVHGCHRITSSAPKPTPFRSKEDHWRFTKALNPCFKLPEEMIWVSQLRSGVNSGHTSHGSKSRGVVYNKQSIRSQLWAQSESNSQKEGHKLGRNTNRCPSHVF